MEKQHRTTKDIGSCRSKGARERGKNAQKIKSLQKDGMMPNKDPALE
jgi:hypothetical protein